MAWAKLDDNFHAHPKVLRAWWTEPASIGMFVLSLSYASDQLTDGRIGEEFVAMLFHDQESRDRAVATLIDCGLWERNGEGWVIHDYPDFNPTRDRILKRREADSRRKRAAK